MFLLERNAAACNASELVLDRILTGDISTPHSLDEAWLRVRDLGEFFFCGHGVGHRVAARPRILVHIMLDLIQDFLHLIRNPLKRCNDLFTCIPADDDALSFLNILWSDLDTNRNAAHLLIGELPPWALVRIVQTCTDAG